MILTNIGGYFVRNVLRLTSNHLKFYVVHCLYFDLMETKT